jgi:photosystem II stability/assembly factor-like uncharacterized protein
MKSSIKFFWNPNRALEPQVRRAKVPLLIIAFVMTTFIAVACGDNDDSSAPTGDLDLTGTVSITGTAKVEQTLTADVSNLDGYRTIFYQWKRGDSSSAAGTDITNATARTYTLVAADEGKYITVTVSRDGYSGSKTSEPTAVVAPADIPEDPELTGTVSITGTAMIGRTLTASIIGLGGTGTVTYQWKAGTSDVGTNSATYVVAEADFGLTITVTVTRAGYSGSKTSEPTAAVTRPFWTVVANSTFGTSGGIISSVAYGDKTFVAVGSTGSPLTGHMAYSEDGKTWTAVADNTFGTSIINGVARGAAGKWVAVGSQGKMAYSTGGVTWTAVTDSTFDGNITSVATNLYHWVATGSQGRMAYSTNGETWTSVTDSKFGYDNINSVATGPLASYFVAVGASGKIAYSTENGQTWYAVANSTFGTTAINGVAYSNSGRFVAVGNSGKMAYSSDGGITWTAVENSPFGTTAVRKVSWSGNAGNNMFVAVGSSGKAAYSTDDGVTWTAVTDDSFGYNDIYGIACDGGSRRNHTWVAVGTLGKIAYNAVAEDE